MSAASGDGIRSLERTDDREALVDTARRKTGSGTRARYLSSTSFHSTPRGPEPRGAFKCCEILAVVHADDDRAAVPMRKAVRQRRRIGIEHDLLLQRRNRGIRHLALVHVLPAEPPSTIEAATK